MRRTSHSRVNCPIARSLERIGDSWALLIVRDAFFGLRRFEDFQERLGIPPTTLARRLRELVAAGILERLPYQERPVRYEYVLTRKGTDLHPVLLGLLAWGNRHYAPAGPIVEVARTSTGERVRPVTVDAATGERLRGPEFRFVPGPGASGATKAWLEERGERPFQSPR
jgi:DNA-binding HxlR family transcriptional regulator